MAIPFAIPAALSRVPWKLLALGVLLLAIAVQTIRLERSERRADKVQFELNEARTALREADLQSKAREQEVERIMRDRTRRDRAEGLAERIERAPLEPGCKTPREILEMDGL